LIPGHCKSGRTKIWQGFPYSTTHFVAQIFRVEDLQDGRLILSCASQIDTHPSPIKRQFLIALESIGSGFPLIFCTPHAPRARAWDRSARGRGDLLEAGEESAKHSMLKRLMENPHLPQLLM